MQAFASGFRPEQARRGPGVGRSRLGECERWERAAVASPVPVDAGPTSALLLANLGTPIGYTRRTCSANRAVLPLPRDGVVRRLVRRSAVTRPKRSASPVGIQAMPTRRPLSLTEAIRSSAQPGPRR